MTNENTLPPGGKILQFGKPNPQPQVATDAPATPTPESETRDFDFHLADGSVYQGHGFLIATAAFVGLGQADGRISFLTPLTNLTFVDLVPAEAEQEDTPA